MMQYADSTNLFTKFNTGTSKAAIATAIAEYRGNPNLGGSTKTFAAIEKLNKQYTKGAASGYRGDPDNTVAIVITDGASNTMSDTISMAQAASRYTTFYGIGVGQGFTVEGNTGAKTEMAGICGCSSYSTCERAFTIADFGALLLGDFVTETIGAMLCEDITTVTTTSTTATTRTATTRTATTVTSTTFVCFSQGYQGPIAGKVAPASDVIRTARSVSTAEACSELCESEGGCYSFSFRADRGTCRLGRLTPSTALQSNAAFDTYVYHNACTTTTVSTTTRTATSTTGTSTTVTDTTITLQPRTQIADEACSAAKTRSRDSPRASRAQAGACCHGG